MLSKLLTSCEGITWGFKKGSHPDRATKETIAMLSFKGVTKYTKLQIKERMKSSNKRFSDLKLLVPHPAFHTLKDHA
jgi:hypothetical protein